MHAQKREKDNMFTERAHAKRHQTYYNSWLGGDRNVSGLEN